MVRYALLLAAVAVLAAGAQETPAPPTGGQVLFSGPPRQVPASASRKETVAVTNAMREAITFTAYTLDVHLAPAQTLELSVQAHVTLRNDGPLALAAIPLQLSSTLNFDDVAADGKHLAFTQQQLPSDADHTGQVHEAAIVLTRPLAPAATITLSIAYSGRVAPSTARLEAIGTPAEIAARSDWDQISEEFTGLRGFGDVLWVPTSAVSVSLGEGATVFAEIGRQKLQNQSAIVAMHVTEEFTGDGPNVIVLDGVPSDLGPPAVAPSASFPGVMRFDLPPTRLGFAVISLIAARRTTLPGTPKLHLYAASGDEPAAEAYTSAASLVDPLLTDWLGTRPRAPLSLIDLGPARAGAGAAPSQLGDAVVEAFEHAQPSQLADSLGTQLAHAWFQSPRPWLSEGVPSFMGVLWTERTGSRTRALERLESVRGALALAEPATPGTSTGTGSGPGQTLIEASLPVYYRAKATYVLWMLRDLAGDKALSAALAAYDPVQDTRPDYFEQLLVKAGAPQLDWFFRDWVYRDQGLPDLSIANVFPSRTTQPNQWLVAVDISNDGYAETEVPVTVRSADTAQTERVRLPARSKVSRRLLITGKPTEVDVNDGSVPEVQASVHQRLLE